MLRAGLFYFLGGRRRDPAVSIKPVSHSPCTCWQAVPKYVPRLAISDSKVEIFEKQVYFVEFCRSADVRAAERNGIARYSPAGFSSFCRTWSTDGAEGFGDERRATTPGCSIRTGQCLSPVSVSFGRSQPAHSLSYRWFVHVPSVACRQDRPVQTQTSAQHNRGRRRRRRPTCTEVYHPR